MKRRAALSMIFVVAALSGPSLTASKAAAQGAMMAPAQMRAALEATAGQWLAFRNWDGKQLVYFTHLVSWKCGIAEVRYQVNGQGGAEHFPLPACDPQMPFNVDAEKDAIYLTFAAGTVREITVQLTYADGSESAVRAFAPCDNAGDSACAVAVR